MTNEEMIVKCSEKLMSLASNVLSDDRKEAVKEFNVNYWTVHRYLKGEVKNLDFGIKLFEFLNARIENRKSALV